MRPAGLARRELAAKHVRILIVGGGAVGQFLAGRLARGGHDAVLIARAAQAQEINARGISLSQDDDARAVRPRAAVEPSDTLLAEPFEIVIVAVKAYSTAEAGDTISKIPSCGAASILTVQNGIGNEEQLSGIFGEDRIIAGALTIAVDRVDATTLSAARKGGLSIAPLGRSPQNWVIPALASMGFPIRAASNWRSLKWSKLCINLLGNAVCAALDWTPEQVYADQTAFTVERACLLEAIQVMLKLGLAPVNLVDFPVPFLVRAAQILPGAVLRVVLANRVVRGRSGKLPSLLLDLRAGKTRTEVTALNGAVAAYGAKAGVEARSNNKVSDVVGGIASGTIAWDDYRGKPQALLS